MKKYLDLYVFFWQIVIRMIKNNNSLKLDNSKKNASSKELTKNRKSGLPVLLEPNSHDIHDELSRMDSFAYSRYNK